jgi:hypothetical protein
MELLDSKQIRAAENDFCFEKFKVTIRKIILTLDLGLPFPVIGTEGGT